jgi:hypothetical protein
LWEGAIGIFNVLKKFPVGLLTSKHKASVIEHFSAHAIVALQISAFFTNSSSPIHHENKNSLALPQFARGNAGY